jgi:hypothetical protein
MASRSKSHPSHQATGPEQVPVVVSEGRPILYANHINVFSTNGDFNIGFGVTDSIHGSVPAGLTQGTGQGAEFLIRELVRVYLSPFSAKALLGALGRQVALFETANGEIKLPAVEGAAAPPR